MMENFLHFGVWEKVLAYAIVPLVMAWMGNRLTAEAILDLHKRRRYNAGFFVWVVVGVIGTWLVESQADRAHNDELAAHKHEADASNKSLEAFEGLLISRQRDSDNLISSLAAKVDPANLAKAFVAASSRGIKKEVGSQLAAAESATELIVKTRDFVAELRLFGKEYSRRIEAIGKCGWTADSTTVTADSLATADGDCAPYLRSQSGRVITTDAGVPILVSKESTAQLQLASAEREGFNSKYLERALSLRDQLLARLGGAPRLKDFPSGRLIAFTGYLTAPSSVTDAADYLEALVKQLSPTTPSH
jgi:hypothetical protein